MTEPVECDSAIAVILDPVPVVIQIAKDAAAFDILEDRFERVDLGSHNGFYDFLRNERGAVIGIRYLPAGDVAELLAATVSQGPNLRFTRDGLLEVLLIMWHQDQRFDPDTSCDQYFGDNDIYRSQLSGRLAISFAVDLLSPQERASFLGDHA